MPASNPLFFFGGVMDTVQPPILVQRKLAELKNLRWLLTRPNQSARKLRRRQERHGRLIAELRRMCVPVPRA